jgi:hypothetical protein
MGRKFGLRSEVSALNPCVRATPALTTIEVYLASCALLTCAAVSARAQTQSTPEDSSVVSSHLSHGRLPVPQICDGHTKDQPMLSLGKPISPSEDSQMSSVDEPAEGPQRTGQASESISPAPVGTDSRETLKCERIHPSKQSGDRINLPPKDAAVPLPLIPAGPVVTYDGGVITVDPQNSQLREVLEAIRDRAGFALDMPATGMDEKVFGRVGPVSLREALVQLLYGSGFNYIIQSASTNPQDVKRIFLSPTSGGATQSAVVRPQSPSDDEANNQGLYGGAGFADPSPQDQVLPVPAARSQAPSSPAANVPGIPTGFNLQQAAADAHKAPTEILDELQKRQLEILDAQSPPQ